MKRDTQDSGLADHRILGGEGVVDPGSALVTDQRSSWRGQELIALLVQSQKLVPSFHLFNLNGRSRRSLNGEGRLSLLGVGVGGAHWALHSVTRLLEQRNLLHLHPGARHPLEARDSPAAEAVCCHCHVQCKK